MNLVAVDATSGEPRPWLPRGADLGVSVFELHGDRIYAGGGFTTIDGEDHANVVAIDRDTGRVLDWDPRVSGGGYVGSIDVHDGIVYLSGGMHWLAGGGELAAIAAVRESDASVLPIEYHTTDESAGGLLVTDDVVIVSGVTRTREGERHGLAAYDRLTGELLPWFEDVWGSPRAFAVSGRTVYVGGISKVGDEPRNGLAAFDLETGEFLPWSPPGPRSAVQDIEVVGGQVAVGGGFRMIAGAPRRDLAAIDLRTNTVTAFDARMAPWYECCGPTERGRVDGLALAGGSLWAGGSFSRFGADQDRPFLARLDPVTGAVGPAVPAPNWKVAEVYAAGGRVYVGGAFWQVGGQERRRVAALDAASGSLTSFAHSFDCDVRAFAPLGGELLTGGCFSFGSAGGGLLSLDPTTGATGTIATPMADPEWIDALAPDGEGGVWVGGEFWVLGEGGPEGFGRLRADGSRDPRVPLLEQDDDVQSLAAAAGEVYVGGWFSSIGGVARDHAAAVRAADGSVGRWDPKPHGTPNVLAALPDGGALMGGTFDTMELAVAGGLARFGALRQMPAPLLLAPPIVTGDRYVDGAQYIDGGDYSGSPNRRDIRWLRCDAAGAGCVDTGRRGIGMLIRAEDVGHRFRVEITAENDSAAAPPVRSAPGPQVMGTKPNNYNQPKIAGEKREGATLTLTSHGDWSGGPTSFRYQWLRCPVGCRRIEGATGPSYTLTTADVNTVVKLMVWGSNAAAEAGGSSNDMGPILPAQGARAPQNLRLPAVLGPIRNPTTLFADDGDWSDYPDVVYVSWERCAADGGSCESLGRNGTTYRVTEANAGYRLRVRVLGENEAGRSEWIYSEPSVVIPAPGAEPLAEDPPPADEDPPPGDEEPPPGDEAPAADEVPPPAVVSSPLAGTSPFAAVAPARVEALSARTAAARSVVIRLHASAPVRAHIELRRRGRAIAGAVADVQAGTTSVRIRLDRTTWRTLRRRGTLVVTVMTGSGPLAHVPIAPAALKRRTTRRTALQCIHRRAAGPARSRATVSARVIVDNETSEPRRMGPPVTERLNVTSGDDRPTALDAFLRARKRFLASERIDMSALAQELGVSRVTLYRWVGSRDRLLVEVIWSLARRTLDNIDADVRETGAERIVRIVTRFLDDVITNAGMQRWLAEEGESAMRLLTRHETGFQPRLIDAMHDLLLEETEAGRLALPVDLHEVAYVIVRLIESYTYLDLITGEQPDARRAEPILRLLLRA